MQKYRQDHQWTALKGEQKIYRNMLVMNINEVISKKVLQFCRDTGRLYDLINNITGTTEENSLLDHTNEEALTHEFAGFFLKKIQKILRELDDTPKYNQ